MTSPERPSPLAAAMLDTDTLSFLMRGEQRVVSQARHYVAVHERLTFSIITQYEIRRGLRAKSADRQTEVFDRLCGGSEILNLTQAVIARASELFGDLKNVGALISDADILIAATAIVNEHVLVTNNLRHFERINGLRLANWRDP